MRLILARALRHVCGGPTGLSADASTHGAWGFTKNLARELAPHGIWVNAVAPGAVATPGVAALQTAGAGTGAQLVVDGGVVLS